MQSDTELSSAVAEIQRITGEPDIQVLLPAWLDLMREGVLVSITIRRWRARKRLSMADLGLPTNLHLEAAIADLLELGDKLLLPKDLIKDLNAAESAIRKHTERATTPTYWGRFIPAASYTAWKSRHEELVQAYLALRDQLYADWPAIQDHVSAQYTVLANTAFDRMCKLAPQSTFCEDRKGFVESFVANIAALMPDRDTVYDSFAVQTHLTYIPLPSLLAEDQAQADRIRAERDRERAEERLQQDTLWARVELEDQALRARQKQLEEMNRDVVAKARQQKEQLLMGFIRDMLAKVRLLFYNAMVDMIETTEKNQQLHPRSVVQLRNTIGQAEAWLTAGDSEMVQLIQQARTMLNGYSQADGLDKSVQVNTILGKMRDVATLTRASLLALDETPRSGLAVGIPDEPPPALITQARRSLHLATTPTPPPVVPVAMPGRRTLALAGGAV